jgi:predicted TIM-barrel fold metal-dependent hydrolase
VTLKPLAEALMQASGEAYVRMQEFARSPASFLKFLDQVSIDRAVLIGSVSPEVIGLDARINTFYAQYARHNPQRLIPCGAVHPQHTQNFLADLDELLRLGIRLIKIHPPHQLFYPNDYLRGLTELETLYRAAEANGIPVMFHTGTSIFPGARSKFGDPIHIDDVAVDFPKLKILLAHGGRPLWMDTAFFLVRRHPNVYLDISGVPPKTLLEYFPRLEEIASKSLFGTDWPGPGVPDIRQNLDAFRGLPLSAAAKDHILSRTALTIWPG